MNVLKLMMNKEFEDLKEKFKGGEEGRKIENITSEGDVLFPLNNEIDFEKLKRKIKKTSKDEIVHTEVKMSYNKFMNDFISDKVRIAKDLNIEKFFKLFVKELYSNSKFYGCIITDEDEFYLNISHPLILKELKDSKYEKLPENFSAIFFEVEDNLNIDEKRFAEVFKRTLMFTNLYKDLNKDNLNMKSDIYDTREVYDMNGFYDLNSTDAGVTIETSISDTTFLVPLQIATKGEMVPYFGYALFASDAVGFSSPDFMTGNISNHGGWESDDSIICTGDYEKRTLEGWYTLSKINLNSMYTDYIINTDTWKEATKTAHEMCKLILEDKEDPIF